jgi:hypothetical protein
MKHRLWRLSAEGWPWQRRGFFVDRDGENPYLTVSFRWLCLTVWFKDPAWTDWGVTRSPLETHCFRCDPVHLERTTRPVDIWGPLIG